MEALRYIPSSGSFSLESTEIPTIQNDDDVLIEVRFAGLCGTDIHIQQVHTDFTYILFCKIAKACAILRILHLYRVILQMPPKFQSLWDMNFPALS